MEKAKVYFTNMRTSVNINLLQKLEKLMDAAGIGQINFDRKFTAIKLHFGEPGNLAFLRPNYAKVVADKVRALGGKPFLTDCNTLYVGRRKDALEHMDAAYENGFSPLSTGCQIIIADGLKGTDEAYVPVPNGKYVKEAKIGRAIMDADVFISLSHFKGHEMAGFGGAIKNIGMGCGSRAGKMEQHSEGKPHVNPQQCVGCGRCIGVCPFDAISPDYKTSLDSFNKKMAEYALAVVYGRPSFHIAVITDVSPNCDCHSENDIPFVPNLGLAASFDPVALDRACADLVNQAPIIPGSVLDEHVQENPGEAGHHDHFHNVAPITDWTTCLRYAEEIGLGTQRYELITLPLA